MSKLLRLGPELALPLDFATEGVAITGMRGSGKSNTEVRWAEVLYDAGIPFAAVDPKGDWDGIRSSADGKTPGLPIPVFGGLRGDFPLEAGMGARVADLLVDENLSAVLDVSLLSKTGARPTFLVAFFDRLMHRHQLEPQVRCVILEEAHSYIPQKVVGDMAGRLKEASASILLEGRAFGLGCWACTQRPARLHKDVLEEVGTLIAHRIGVAATNDLRTVAGWFEHHDIGDDAKAVLPKLRSGEALVLSPQFDLARRVQIDRRHTFDSAATPKVGATLRRPSTMADIDQAAIKEALSEAIERAKADDPAELRKRVAALERELAKERARQPEVEVQTVEVPVIPEAFLDVATTVINHATDLAAAVRKMEDADARMRIEADRLAKSRPVPGDTTRREAQPTASPPPRRGPPAGVARGTSPRSTGTASARGTRPPAPAGDLTGPQQRVLDAIAWWNAVGYAQPTKGQVGFIAGYRVGKKVGGAYGNLLGQLRSSGFVDYPREGLVELTDEGSAVAQDAGIEQTTEGLQSAVYARLNEPERRVLAIVVEAYPGDLSKQEAGEAAGYTVGEKVGGAYGNILGRLRSLGLIDYPAQGRVMAEPVLFL